MQVSVCELELLPQSTLMIMILLSWLSVSCVDLPLSLSSVSRSNRSHSDSLSPGLPCKNPPLFALLLHLIFIMTLIIRIIL